MLKTLIKAVAYSKAPKTTFAVMHPKKAVRLKKAKFDMRYALAPRIAAVGAAAVALPVGYLLARAGLRNGSQAE